MEGEFVEADIAAVRAEGVRIRTEGENAGAVVELYIADFDLLGETGVFAFFEDGDFEVLDAVGEDGLGFVVEFAELVAGGDVLDGGALVFAGEEIIAAGMMKTFANVFEGV